MDKWNKTIKSLGVWFTIFYTSLTILNHLMLKYGYTNSFFMGNLTLGIILSLILSLIYVLLSANNQD